MLTEIDRMSALFLAHGGHVHLRSTPPGKGFLKVVKGPFVQDMLARAATTKTYADTVRGSDEVGLSLGSGAEDDANKTEQVLTGPVTSIVADAFDLQCVQKLLSTSAIRGQVITELSVEVGRSLIQEIGVAYRFVEPAHRPPHCRRIEAGRYYTLALAVQAKLALCSVVFVHTVFSFGGKLWVLVFVMTPKNKIDDATLLPVMERSDVCMVRSAADILEPCHVVHLCGEQCKTLGPGFRGSHDLEESKDFLHNENFTF